MWWQPSSLSLPLPSPSSPTPPSSATWASSESSSSSELSLSPCDHRRTFLFLGGLSRKKEKIEERTERNEQLAIEISTLYLPLNISTRNHYKWYNSLSKLPPQTSNSNNSSNINEPAQRTQVHRMALMFANSDTPFGHLWKSNWNKLTHTRRRIMATTNYSTYGMPLTCEGFVFKQHKNVVKKTAPLLEITFYFVFPIFSPIFGLWNSCSSGKCISIASVFSSSSSLAGRPGNNQWNNDFPIDRSVPWSLCCSEFIRT